MVSKRQRFSPRSIRARAVVRRSNQYFAITTFVPASRESRIAVTVSKQIARTAVARNRLRRRAIAIWASCSAALGDYHIIVKPMAAQLDASSFSKELTAIFRSVD